MGCDGGTIPRRDELVKTKKKPEQKDKQSELNFRWKHCALSQRKLEEPIVACELGRLYSKEAVVEALLSKTIPDSASHIRNLRDIRQLNLTFNSAKDSEESSDYICPIVAQEMNGRFRFCFSWACGCVISERAVKELLLDGKCLVCQKEFKRETDLVVLNPSSDKEIDEMKAKMEERRSKQKSERKRKSDKPETATATKKAKTNGATAAPVSLGVTADSSFKKATSSYKVAEDPNASEVLKSIFTTHKSHADQPKAHWVTYNPFYN